MFQALVMLRGTPGELVQFPDVVGEKQQEAEVHDIAEVIVGEEDFVVAAFLQLTGSSRFGGWMTARLHPILLALKVQLVGKFVEFE